MFKFGRKPQPKPPSAACNAHRESIRDLPGDNSPYVRKDVFREYAARMDERCGNHEDLIAQAVKKIDLLNKLFTGLVISLLVTGAGFLLNVLLRLI